MIYQAIPTGRGAFTIPLNDGLSINVFTYKPTSIIRGYVIASVGTARGYENERRAFRQFAEEHRLCVIVEYRDAARWPGTVRFNRCGVYDDLDNTNLEPRARWTSRYFRAMRDWAIRTDALAPDTKFYFYGHSAGAEYNHRAALLDVTAMQGVTIVCANPTIYTFPRFADDPVNNWPLGMRDLTPSAQMSDLFSSTNRAAWYALDMCIYTGDADTGPGGADGPGGMAQGTGRHDRALNFYAETMADAEALDVPFNWRLVIAEGVGHTTSGMVNNTAAVDAFFGGAP